MKKNIIDRRIDELLEKKLKQNELEFTYSSVELRNDATYYYADDDYHMEMIFHNYNGTEDDHLNAIHRFQGKTYQTMFEYHGFPSFQVTFDRTLIPDETVATLARVAELNEKYNQITTRNSKFNDEEKKANI